MEKLNIEESTIEMQSAVEELNAFEDTADIDDLKFLDELETATSNKENEFVETRQKSDTEYSAGEDIILQTQPEPVNPVNTEPLNLEEPPLDININDIRPVIEGILFVAGNSVAFEKIQKIINIDIGLFRKKITELNNIYKNNRHCFKIIEVANGFQIVTRSEYAEWIRKFFGIRKMKHLPPSSLETLAIIAYKQPVTKAKIENIRGVNTDAQLQQLLEKKMIQMLGRAEELGRPILYGTTREFLEYFGLRDLKDLPDARELDKLIASKREEEQKKIEKILNEKENKNKSTENIDQLSSDETLSQNEPSLSEINNDKLDETQKNEEIISGKITVENTNKSSESDLSDADAELEKEFYDALTKEKSVRRATQEMFEKMNTPEEFKTLMESKGFKTDAQADIILDDEESEANEE